MSGLIKNFWSFSTPLRVAYKIISFICIVYTVTNVMYNGFFEHRNWLNTRISEQYAGVEETQTIVLKLILDTVPSRRNNDAPPTKEEVDILTRALAELSGKVSQVDATSTDVVRAADKYRGSISKLSGALVRYDYEDSETQTELLAAVDDWDVAAKQYSSAIENRIGSFFGTLLPSV